MEQIIGETAAPAADLIKDSDTASFAADVIDASRDVPVIVDFWAPWCGPCKTLGPALEKVVKQAGGKVRMVKINVDENQQLAAQLRVQSIPTVFGFKNGQPVDGFMGAVPESQLKQFVERLAGPVGPSPAEQLLEAGQAALEAGDMDTAAQAFGQLMQAEPDNLTATGGLARVLVHSGELEAARELLDQVPEKDQGNSDISGARAALALAEQAADAGDTAELRAKLEANPADHQARFDLALALVAGNRREDGVAELLEIIRRDRNWNDEAARKQLIEFFEAWGPTDELTQSARRQLSSLLFS